VQIVNYTSVKVVKSFRDVCVQQMESLAFLRLFGLKLSCIWP